MKRHVVVLTLAVLAFAGTRVAADPMTGSTGGGQSHSNLQPGLGIHYIVAMQGTYPSRTYGKDDPKATGAEPLLGEVRLFAGNFAPRGWAFCAGQMLPISQNTALFSLLGTNYGGDGRTSFGLPDLRGRTAIHHGTGPGLSPRLLGQKTGVESVTLTEAQMPAHSHTLPWGADTTLQAGGGQAHTNMQPSLALNAIVAMQGIYPSRAFSGEPLDAPTGAYPYIGEISLFAGTFAPRGWAQPDGQLLSISQNDALFSLVGTIYGGDGRTTFGLPDLRGRAAMGEGTGTGLSTRPLGLKIGQENATLTEAQMPSHNHTLPPTSLSTGDAGGGQAQPNLQPSLALNYIIAMEGIFPSPTAGNSTVSDPLLEPADIDPYLGEVCLFGGNFAPRGWAFCDGQLLPINLNQALFAILGTTYGGDGRTAFALPDLRGRVPVGPGTGPGLTTVYLGQRIGVEAAGLTVGQLPAHDHEVPEPASLSVLITAAAALVLRRRRG